MKRIMTWIEDLSEKNPEYFKKVFSFPERGSRPRTNEGGGFGNVTCIFSSDLATYQREGHRADHLEVSLSILAKRGDEY